MARSTVLQLAHDVADDLGLRRPPTLFAGYDEGDTNDLKLRRALIKTARFLLRFWEWPETRADVVFTSVANGPQTVTLPALFDRFAPGAGVLDTLRNEPGVLVGQFTQLQPGQLPPRIEYMVRGGVLHLVSPYPAGAAMRLGCLLEVVGRNAAGGDLSRFTADTDVSLWPDELMHLGMVWAIKNRDGDRTSEDYQEFRSELMEHITHTASDAVLVLGDGPSQEMQTPRLPLGPW